MVSFMPRNTVAAAAESPSTRTSKKSTTEIACDGAMDNAFANSGFSSRIFWKGDGGEWTVEGVDGVEGVLEAMEYGWLCEMSRSAFTSPSLRRIPYCHATV